MKKIIFSVCVILISLVTLSCKSSKEAKEGATEELKEVVIEAPKKEKKDDKKSKKEEEKKDEKSKEDEDRGMFGWIDSTDKNPEYSDGIVKIKTDGKLGTFCVYAIDEKGKDIPVFSPLNEFSSSSFYLKAGNKKYKLHADKNVHCSAKALDNGVVLIYHIDKVGEVYVKMEVFPTVMDSPADTIKVTVDIKNTSKKPNEYALKVILDTILGERRSNHFYTEDNIPISSEFATRGMDGIGYFTSKNEKASMQLLFNGGDVTPPSFFALAGYSRLEGSDWEPNMHTLGAFDTVLSYNNSAVCAIWPERRIAVDKTSRIVFYLSLGLYENTPNGYRFVYGLGEPEKKVVEEKPVLLPPKKKVEEKKSVPVVITPNVVEEGPIKSVEFNVDNIKKEHLTTEYVQSLLNRITELEQNGAEHNRAEILQLNAELDAILAILKKN